MKTIFGVAVVALSFGANGKLQAGPMELDLSGTWRLAKANDTRVSCPIAVPGGVHSALLKAKLIEDSFWGRNETNNLWVGKSCWIVSRTFEANGDLLAKKEIVLRLEDCDTFAKVSVNGTVVGNTTDRFQRYTFDVKPSLKAGENEISVLFSSPEAVADARHERVKKPFPMSNVVWAKNQALIRKPACHAGWD